MIKITTLIENHADPDRGLMGEHGLSMFIETGTERILFDTGQTGDFLRNASRMGIGLKDVSRVLLSHGHYDHTGGVLRFLESRGRDVPVYVGKGFFRKKYKRLENGDYRYNGNPFTREQLYGAAGRVHEVEREVSVLSEGLVLFRGFHSPYDFEETSGEFYLQEDAGYGKDDFSDEMALGIVADNALLLVSGCAHPGILGMARRVTEELGLPLRGVIGGSHLLHAGKARMEAVIAGFKRMDPEVLALSHCTGDENMGRLREAFGSSFHNNVSGSELIFR